MILVTVKLMGHLIKIAGTNSLYLEMEDGSVIRDLLEQIFSIYGAEMRNQVMDHSGESLAAYYKILVNGRNFKLLNAFSTPLENGQVIHIMPPVAGG
ncbi:MAG: MoaD family protein [Bacillota bacterium]